MVLSHLNTTHIRARRVYALCLTKTSRRLVIRLPNPSRTKHYSLCLTTHLTNPATLLKSDTALQLLPSSPPFSTFHLYISPTPSPSSVPYHHTPLSPPSPPTPSTHTRNKTPSDPKPEPHTPPRPQFTSPTSQMLHDLVAAARLCALGGGLVGAVLRV